MRMNANINMFSDLGSVSLAGMAETASEVQLIISAKM